MFFFFLRFFSCDGVDLSNKLNIFVNNGFEYLCLQMDTLYVQIIANSEYKDACRISPLFCINTYKFVSVKMLGKTIME